MRENPVHQVCEENVWTGGAKRCVLCANHRGDCKLVFVRENNTQKKRPAPVGIHTLVRKSPVRMYFH